MRRAVVFVFAFGSVLPLAPCMPVLMAQQGPSQAIDASKMPESGPSVVGGGGATMGPNSKNQAIMPMPGSRQAEELSEPQRDPTLPLPEVRPVAGPRQATPAPSAR